MSETKHTPAPWYASPCGHNNRVYASVTSNIGKPIASCKAHPRTREARSEANANARLIAAAPDLLAALIEARTQLEAYAQAEGEDYNCPQINAAIKRATEA